MSCSILGLIKFETFLSAIKNLDDCRRESFHLFMAQNTFLGSDENTYTLLRLTTEKEGDWFLCPQNSLNE